MEDDHVKPAELLLTRVPAEFKEWFEEAARAEGLTVMDALRQASLEWGKKHHPKVRD